MNIDGLKFNFPEQKKSSIPEIKPVEPGKNSLEQKSLEKNLNKYKTTQPNQEKLKEEPSQKSSEDLKKEKNQADGKGEIIDVIT